MSAADSRQGLRALPSVDALLRSDLLCQFARDLSREPLVRVIREVLDEQRRQITEGQGAFRHEEIAALLAARLTRLCSSAIGVINATGVVLHTNLGRAPLSDGSIAAMSVAALSSDLEMDLQTGDRGSRYDRIQAQFQALTGAEAAHVTVNNAAAVTLALAALARDREVIVSRGQLVEIGGGFRVPQVLHESGAKLVEVGTTNRTRLSDYEAAFSDRTGCILHVHTSNFKVVGFTQSPSIGELARLAHTHGVLLVDDNGSGSLLDTARFGLAHEPMPIESIESGSDLVAFSGDKLLGGPQAGIVLGRADLISRLARYPLARAVRPDKLILASLSATLVEYLRGTAVHALPVLRMLAATEDELERRARGWQSRALNFGLRVEVDSGKSAVGGGSLPGETLPTTLIQLPVEIRAEALRLGSPHVVGRTHNDAVLLDLRTVLKEQDEPLLDAVLKAKALIDR